MARDRAALTDKEERILVHAQLMGLSTASMVKIGNRIRALEQEREAMARIDNSCQGVTWEQPKDSTQFKITTSDGLVIEAVRGKRGRSNWNCFSWAYNIIVTNPGTRFKPKKYNDREIRCNSDWKKKLMPAQSKELYSLINWIKNSMPRDQPDE